METQETSEQQPKKKRPGRNGNVPPEPTKGFHVLGQPSPDAKKAGWERKRKTKELANAILDLEFVGAKGSSLKKQAAQYLGIPESQVSVRMMMLFRQAEKAIQKGDTAAFNAYMDRADGKPVQAMAHTSSDGEDLPPAFDLSALSADDLKKLKKMYAKHTGSAS